MWRLTLAIFSSSLEVSTHLRRLSLWRLTLAISSSSLEVSTHLRWLTLWWLALAISSSSLEVSIHLRWLALWWLSLWSLTISTHSTLWWLAEVSSLRIPCVNRTFTVSYTYLIVFSTFNLSTAV